MQMKVRKGAKIRNRFNQAPHLTPDTNGIVTTSQLDTTNESQEASDQTSGLEVIKLEFILKLKIKCNDWLLAETCPQAANYCALF